MNLTMREVMLGFRRAPLLSVLSITTIAFSLFAFGLFSLVALNIRSALRDVESQVEVRAFVADGTSVDEVGRVMEEISTYREVERLEYVSPEQALERARRDLGEFKDVFDAAFLPGSIDIRLHEGSRDPETVKRVVQRVQTFKFVDDVRYGEEWVTKLYRIRTVATVAGVALGLAFAAVAVIIIGATIRMAMMARGAEISIMRLVGATDSFIRRPFLIDGFLKGILGGLLALLLTWLASTLITQTFIKTEFFDLRLASLGVLGGAVLGVLGSAFSVSRHLRQVR